LFKMLAGALFLYTAAVGTRLTTDCLSEEKREGTLGLLFLTDLKGYDVVFGKLVATSVNAFYGMVAVVPVMAISLLLGGVTRGEFWRVVLVAVNLLFFFLSIGLFASAVCRQDSRAMALTLIIGAFFLGLGPFWVAWHDLGSGSYDFRAAMLPCPLFGCFAAFASTATAGLKPSDFWLNVGITHLYAWIFLLISCSIVPSSWQDEGSGVRLASRKESAGSNLRGRGHLLETNPFLWRASRGRSKSLKLWVTVGLLVLLWLWLSVRFHLAAFEPIKDIFILMTMTLLFKIQFAGEASRALSVDRRSGGLELLLTTPLTEADIIRGQRLALWQQFALPVAFAFVANVVCWRMEAYRYMSGRDGWGWLHLSLGIFLLLDLFALTWTGMWFGLKAQKPGQAVLKSLGIIVGLPVGIFLACMPVIHWLAPTHDFDWPEPTIWVAFFGVLTDAWFGWNAKVKLCTQFRSEVTERISSKTQRSLASNPATTGR
jgi:hypothetical protein